MPTTADDAGGANALQMDKVSVAYGGIQALAGIDLSVRPHELMAVVGPNGAGKSTLLNAVSGLAGTSVRGATKIFGNQLAKGGADQVARPGLGRSFQAPPLIDEVSVLENVLGG